MRWGALGAIVSNAAGVGRAALRAARPPESGVGPPCGPPALFVA